MTEAAVTIKGRSAEDICEAEAGGVLSRAILLSELHGNVEATAADVEYDVDSPEAEELLGLCRQLDALLERLSIDERSGRLTFNRECPRCSGDGSTRGEDPCIECEGNGYVTPAP